MFETDEIKLCKMVLGLRENEAYQLIREYDCLPFTVKRDRNEIDYTTKCAHSYRVNMVVSHNRVVSVFLG